MLTILFGLIVAAASSQQMNAPPSSLHCGAGNPVVWVNTESHVYHMKGSKYYGNTAHGEYMCRRSAIAAHNHEAKSEKNSTESTKH
jgi:hypothetical protein